MCILTAHAQYSSHPSQYTPISTASRLQDLGFTFPAPSPTATPVNVTSVASNCTGTILEVNSNYGYIDFTLDESLWEKTLTKNGASSLPKNVGKLWFFENQVSGPLSKLSVGDNVCFDVKHVKTSNKLVAHSVTTDSNNEINRLAKAMAYQLASTTTMQASPFTTTAATKKFTVMSTGNSAKVIELCSAHGYLDYSTGSVTKLPFHGTATYACDFSNLKINDTVQFDLVRNNITGKLFAQSVKFESSEPAKMSYCGHFIDMQETVPRATAKVQQIIKTHSSVTGRVQTVTSDYATVQYEDLKVFVHNTALYGTILQELNIGDVMKFDIFYNQKNNKHLGRNVTLDEKVNPLNVGHFQMMETTKFVTTAEPTEVVREIGATANIIKIGNDYGLLDFYVMGQEYVYFHENSLIGTHLTELAEKQLMTFTVIQHPTSGKYIAKNVSVLTGTKRPSLTMPNKYVDIVPSPLKQMGLVVPGKNIPSGLPRSLNTSRRSSFADPARNLAGSGRR